MLDVHQKSKLVLSPVHLLGRLQIHRPTLSRPLLVLCRHMECWHAVRQCPHLLQPAHAEPPRLLAL